MKGSICAPEAASRSSSSVASGFCVAQVRPDRLVEQVGVWVTNADRLAKRRETDIAHVDAVQADRATPGVVQA